MAHRAIFECKACPKHCTVRTEERNERPPRCLYWRDSAVWLRKDGPNKEKMIDWPRFCGCGGRLIPIFAARHGEEPKEYAECQKCKGVLNG